MLDKIKINNYYRIIRRLEMQMFVDIITILGSVASIVSLILVIVKK